MQNVIKRRKRLGKWCGLLTPKMWGAATILRIKISNLMNELESPWRVVDNEVVDLHVWRRIHIKWRIEFWKCINVWRNYIPDNEGLFQIFVSVKASSSYSQPQIDLVPKMCLSGLAAMRRTKGTNWSGLGCIGVLSGTFEVLLIKCSILKDTWGCSFLEILRKHFFICFDILETPTYQQMNDCGWMVAWLCWQLLFPGYTWLNVQDNLELRFPQTWFPRWNHGVIPWGIFRTAAIWSYWGILPGSWHLL